MKLSNLYSRIFAALFIISLLFIGLYKNSIFDNTFAEKYHLREKLVTWTMNFKFFALKDNFYNNMYTRDQQWLNYINENSIDDAQNAIPFTQDELEKIHSKLGNLRQNLLDLGIKFYLVVPPNKLTIYYDDLYEIAPKLNSTSRLDQLVEYETTHNGIEIIDVRPELIEAKKVERVYYSTDTHWNAYGAWLGYTKLMSLISKDFPGLEAYPLDRFIMGETTWTGDLARLSGNLHINELSKTLKLINPKKVSYDAPIYYDYTASTDEPDLPVALVFKDSFYYMMQEYMIQHFNKMVCVGSYTFDYDKVDEIKPDLVIYEITERYLHLLLYLP